MNRGNVIVVEDDDAVLASILDMLTLAGFTSLGFSDPVAFLKALPTLPRSCIVTDVRMPRINGITLMARLNTLGYGDWPMILISGHASVPTVVEAMKMGAVTFLEKPFQPEQLILALEGAGSLQPSAAAPVGNMELQPARERYRTLTPREKEAVAHVVAGLRTKEIAVRMDVSPRTVEAFRRSALRKMDVANFTVIASLMAQGLDA